MLRQKGGTIVNISSVCAVEAWPSYGPYSAAKAGLLQFTKCLYAELRPAGARATCIIPSWGPADFARAAGQRPFDAETAARCIQPLELGKVVVYVCGLPPRLPARGAVPNRRFSREGGRNRTNPVTARGSSFRSHPRSYTVRAGGRRIPGTFPSHSPYPEICSRTRRRRAVSSGRRTQARHIFFCRCASACTAHRHPGIQGGSSACPSPLPWPSNPWGFCRVSPCGGRQAIAPWTSWILSSSGNCMYPCLPGQDAGGPGSPCDVPPLRAPPRGIDLLTILCYEKA